MLLDWQAIRQLLLAWHSDAQNAIFQFHPVYSMLTATLPQADIWCLTHKSTGYQLHHLVASQAVFETSCGDDLSVLIDCLSDRSFDAAIVLTQPGESPYQLAYLCYLANIPHRIGQSVEFGGGVLSWPIEPPLDPVTLQEYYFHLLKMVNICTDIDQFTHSLCV